MSRFVKPDEARQARQQARRSLYDDRFKAKPRVTPVINVWGDGRVTTGVEVDGEYAPSESLICCESALDCDRPECWTRIGYIGQHDYTDEEWLWR
jgi:hypothetical protein